MSSVLALVDYQPTMIKSIASGDKTIIKKATVIAAKPRVFWMYWFFLSSINPKSNGDVFPEIRELFPEQEKFQVPSFDAFEDQRTYHVVKKTNKNKLVISDLWINMCYPITLESLVSEWMHDWDNPKSGKLLEEVYSKYRTIVGLH
jgi:nicotinamidase-related amidase